MKVNVKFYATIKNIAGTAQTTVDTESGTVGDVISALGTRYGDRFREEILNPDGNLRQNVKVLINGLNIDKIAPLQNQVKEGDTLHIFPPILAG